jgi:hypothetical protein
MESRTASAASSWEPPSTGPAYRRSRADGGASRPPLRLGALHGWLPQRIFGCLRRLLAHLTLALLVLVASTGAAAAASLEPSHGPAGAGIVRASDAASVAPFELPAESARPPVARVVLAPLPTVVARAPHDEPMITRAAPLDGRARALRRMPQRRIRRHASRAPDEH